MTDTTPEHAKTSIGESFKKDAGVSSSFSEVRREYSTHRNEVKQDLIEAGASHDTSAFRKILRKLARRNTEKDRESMMDELTGLYNKRGFNKRFEEEVERAKRFGGDMMIINIDANRLKQINDAEGHQAGDELIQDVANLLKQLGRPTDVVGRVGGDEYRVLLTQTNEEQALDWANRMIRDFNNSDVHVSMGASKVKVNNIAQSLKEADDRMYEMKNMSRKNPGAYYTDGKAKVL